MESNFFKEYIEKNNLGRLENINIKEIKIDSRKIEKDDVFLAIKGEKNDANDFADDVFAKGAALIITDKTGVKDKYGERAVLVENTVKFLQQFSSYYRDKINPIVIGITGSNGKTTTKDFLAAVLSLNGKTKKTIGNLNNHIGVPLTLLQLEKGDEYIVVEMGMSGFGEIDLLSGIAKPDYGIITNIGDSHMEYLKTRENVFIAKSELVKHVKNKMIVNGDDVYLNAVKGIKAGFSSGCEVRAEDVIYDENGAVFDIITDTLKYRCNISLAGEHNVLDAVLAAAAAKEIRITTEKIVEGLKTAEFTKMRFEKIIKDGVVYINDAYNASPVSMKYSIETFSEIYNNGENIKIAVLGDMLELGEKSKEYHEEIADIVNKSKIDILFLFGNEMKYLKNKIGGSKNTVHFDKKEDIKLAIENTIGNKVVLLKGSRGMKLEDILK